jgi:hypothetical protein
MNMSKLSKEDIKSVVDAAVLQIAEDICACFKKFPLPQGFTKEAAAETFVRELALRSSDVPEVCSTEQALQMVSAAAFLAEKCDEIVAKVLELEGQTQTIVE